MRSRLPSASACRSVSRSLGCRLTLLPVPGIVADQRTREVLLADVHVQRAVEAFVAEHHRERGFHKRRRDRADTGALGRRARVAEP